MRKKYSNVTRSEVAAEISYDRTTGELTTLKPRMGLKAGDKIPATRRVIDLCGISTTPSMIAWILEVGEWPIGRVIRIDADLGLQFDNLRDGGVIGPVKKRLPELSVDRLRQVLKYCPSTGLFSWLKPPSASAKRGDVAGCLSRGDGYIRLRIDGTLHLAHRLAMLYIYQCWPDKLVDHKNGIKSDNGLENLRSADKSQNAQNTRDAWSHGTSGLLGAHWSSTRNCWTSAVYLNGKRKSLGEFSSAQEAHEAYVDEKRRMHEFSMI